MSRRHPLEPIFHPGTVAVLGASETPGKAAERRTRSLLQGGFAGRVCLVNPRRDTLFGLKAYPSLREFEGPVDLVMVVIPGKLIPQAVAEAADKGARGVIIITAGLGESGPEGRKIEAEIMALAQVRDLRVIGPNCSGLYSASGRVNLLGIPGIQPGHLSVLAQSGNIIDSLTHFARRRGRGFSRIISSGNAIGVRFHEYVDYLAEDPHTKVILLYLESIKEGDLLIQACRRAVVKKPVVALKVGRTQAGRRASASHTGALAADDRIVEAALAQAGVLRVANVDEMFDLGEAFLDCPRPRGNRVAILSEGGGDNSVAADNAERWGLRVPLLTPERQARIKAHLLAGMPAHNPIDYGGTAEENPLLIAACVQEVMADEAIDLVYLTGFFGGFRDIIAPHVGELEAEAARRLVQLVAEHHKPLAVHTSFAEEEYESMKILRAGGVPLTLSSDRAAECLAALARQAENVRRLADPDLILSDGRARPAALALLEAARGQGRSGLLEPEARELLRLYGFDLPPAAVAETAEAAVAAAADLGFPVALKVVSPSIVHKSDIGGVKLNLTSAAQVGQAAGEILAAGRRAAPEGYLGLLVSPMAPPGQECILGLVRDLHFGSVLMFGLGGVFVEVLEDVAFGVLPLSPDDLDRMVAAVRGRRLLTGFRGRPALDVDCLKDMLARLSRLALDNPEIQELDLNPVLLHPQGASVVDARVILKF